MALWMLRSIRSTSGRCPVWLSPSRTEREGSFRFHRLRRREERSRCVTSIAAHRCQPAPRLLVRDAQGRHEERVNDPSPRHEGSFTFDLATRLRGVDLKARERWHTRCRLCQALGYP
jgi:hypothetical protein